MTKDGHIKQQKPSNISFNETSTKPCKEVFVSYKWKKEGQEGSDRVSKLDLAKTFPFLLHALLWKQLVVFFSAFPGEGIKMFW